MRELNHALVTAVDALPDDLRTVFVLRMIERLDTEEAAACLDLTPSNVKVRLHRARAMLQSRLDDMIGADIRRMHQFDGKRCDCVVHAVIARLANR
jgi:RNA polymerase sigma-70 factor (ECF subfamily)